MTPLEYMPPGCLLQPRDPTFNEILQRMSQFGIPPSYSMPPSEQTMCGQHYQYEERRKVEVTKETKAQFM